ncbi:MAG: DUF2142 domain-containing protein [Pedobacter sp.]|nr:MAG: DUF2142 domain-containing protein [Pedobacter sp.]
MDIKKQVRGLKAILSRWVNKPEYVYLVIASVSVIGFVFITPPFQGPDEEAHYIRTQYIARGYLIPVDVNKSEASLPLSMRETLHSTFYKDDLRGSSTNKYELFRTKEALTMPLNKDDTYKPPMISYSPIPYLPAAPGVALANLLNLSPLVSMFIARLSLGAASILLIFLAIRFIPHKKYLFAAIGLIPMLLFQQSVITADSVSYALLALFIAYVLHLRASVKNISRKQWLILGAICIGITLAKPLLYLFLPLVLLVVKKKVDLRWIVGMAVTCAVLLYGWMAVSSIKTDSISISGTPDNVDQGQQIETLIDNPKRGARVAWNSYMTAYGDDEVRGVIGIFGAADTIYPLWMFSAYVFLLGLLFTINIDGSRTLKIHRGWKIAAGILCIGYFTAVNLALYLGYTPVNFDIVYGVQGRYFLPLFFIAAAVIFIGGIQIAKKDVPKVRIWTVASIAVLVLLALLITFQRYYLYTP